MLDTFDAVGSSKDLLGAGLGRIFLAVFIMLFTYALFLCNHHSCAIIMLRLVCVYY